MGHGSKCWCRSCTPERHSRAEAAGGLPSLLGARRIDEEQPSELLPGGARNRPRAHRSIMLEYNFTSYFALNPFDIVDKLFVELV